MSPRPPYVDNPYRTGCEQSPPLQPLQPSTWSTRRYTRPAEALHLYSPLQPSAALYISTSLHPLQYTSLYITPQDGSSLDAAGSAAGFLLLRLSTPPASCCWGRPGGRVRREGGRRGRLLLVFFPAPVQSEVGLRGRRWERPGRRTCSFHVITVFIEPGTAAAAAAPSNGLRAPRSREHMAWWPGRPSPGRRTCSSFHVIIVFIELKMRELCYGVLLFGFF